MAHSVSSTRTDGASPAVEPSIGTLVQSAMADVSTLVRNEIELAKAEIGASAKKGGVGAASFAAAGLFAAFAGIFFFIALAEFVTWLGLARWISYLIVFGLLIALAGIAALIGKKMMNKIEKPERTIESLRELPDVMHRQVPGARHREVPVVRGGKVERRNEPYRV
ncbi:phage holin family protein [Blastococcus sp. HT6-30]|uniref:phage holin family protein n=1 Tax=Blastococcus sp. HT6-30 TaxID=3144843 RepID=UPI003218EA9F